MTGRAGRMRRLGSGAGQGRHRGGPDSGRVPGMGPMPVVASDAHREHDPPYEVNYGEVVRPVYERPKRAERVRGALAAAGHPRGEPRQHGTAPVLAVHDPALVEFLEGAWPAWRAAGGPEALIPDPFAIPRLARGGGRDSGRGAGPPRRC